MTANEVTQRGSAGGFPATRSMGVLRTKKVIISLRPLFAPLLSKMRQKLRKTKTEEGAFCARRPLFVLSAFKMAFVWREMGICRKHHSGIVDGGGIRFQRAFVLFFGPDQRATPAPLPPIVPPTFPSLLGARGLFCLSPRGFSSPLSFSLSFFLSFFLPAEGLKAVKVAGWHSVTGAGGAPGWPAGYRACKGMGNPAAPPPPHPPPPPPTQHLQLPSSPLVNTLCASSSPPRRPLFLLCHLPFLTIVHSVSQKKKQHNSPKMLPSVVSH